MSQGLAVDEGAAPVPRPPEPSVLDLEDILYDIVASGADPSLPAGTLEAVQTFLHEHARNKHTSQEFLAFFAKHGLSTVKETTLTLALPPMELRSPLATPTPTPTPAPAAQPPAPLAEPEAIEVAPVAPARTSRAIAWLCGVAALAALGGGAYLGVSSLRGEIASFEAEQRAIAAKLARAEAEAASLRLRVEESAARMEQLDRKSELLLQTFASPLDPHQR